MNQAKAIQKLNDEITKALRQDEDGYVDALTGYYDKFLMKTQADLTALYSRIFQGGTLNYQDYARLQLEDQTMKMIRPALNQLQMETAGQLDQSLKDIYWDSYKMNAWALDQTTPPNVNVSMFKEPNSNPAQDPLLTSLIQQQINVPFKSSMFSDRLWNINLGAAQKIGAMTRNAAINGWSVPELSQSIRDLVGVPADEKLATRPNASAAKMRADMISRTELMRAVNLAKSDLYDRNSDIIETKVWLTAEDFRVCDDCDEMDGMTEEDLNDQGYDTTMPAHPRCRCTWIPKMVSWSKLLGPLGKGMENLEHIDEYEMATPNLSDGTWTKVGITPYKEWLKQAA